MRLKFRLHPKRQWKSISIYTKNWQYQINFISFPFKFYTYTLYPAPPEQP